MIRREKKVIITFDYELFLGNDSGELFTSLINPTDKILDKLKKNEAKALFFIDTPFLLYLKKEYPESYEIVKNQIFDILKQGSYIGLHIHPQWIDAQKLSENRWTFKTFEHYRFHSLSDIERDTLFSDCYNELDSILKKASFNNINQKEICHYRAGGWSIQPFAIFKKYFEQYNLVYDFSVKTASKIEELPYHYYNYENVTMKKDFWMFNDDPCTADNKGIFNEYPLTAVKFNKYIYWKIKRFFDKKCKIKNKIYGDGIGLSKSIDKNKNEPSDKKRKTMLNRIKNKFCKKTVHLIFENYNSKIFKFILKFIFLKKDVAVVIGHPKTFTDLSLDNLSYTIKKYKTYIPQ